MTNIIIRFALLFVIAALAILGATGNLISPLPVVIGIQVLAIAISVWARVSFPTGTFRVEATPAVTTIIQRGPYRFIRHPMYSATLLFIWSSILSHIGLWTLLLGVFITVIVASRIVIEEQILKQQYSDYQAYVKNTKAVIPFLL